MKSYLSAKQIGGIAFLVGVIALLAYMGLQFKYFLQDEQRSPVQVIEFTGEFNHVDIGELERVIRNAQPGSFFALDVNDVHKVIEDHPWIYRASVRKQWPKTLQIYLVEQIPVVVWNGDMMLNPYGEVFNVAPGSLVLPQLFGPGGSEITALEGYNAMQRLLATSGLNIAELSLSERFAWQLQLQNGIRLNLGRHEFMDRLQRFVDVYPLLSRQETPIDYIDLRYDTGLAVGWQQHNKESATDV